MSVLRAGAHECQIRSASVLVLPRLQRFSITLKKGKSRGLPCFLRLIKRLFKLFLDSVEGP
ncbi:hypothetical protein EX219_17445 [Bacillus aerophilus]|nr:hypothetical protein [Bacillus aerophilus]MBX7015226.1 hypothetical protein [Bacillus aerophilus]